MIKVLQKVKTLKKAMNSQDIKTFCYKEYVKETKKAKIAFTVDIIEQFCCNINTSAVYINF